MNSKPTRQMISRFREGRTVGPATAKELDQMVFQDKTRVVVSISDMKFSGDPGSYLITHSLGSCIGVVAYDPIVQIGGMLHFQLPHSNGHQDRAKEKPFMFANLGIPLLLDGMSANGASLGRTNIGIFGGASILRDGELFEIGIKNVRMAKKILWRQCLRISNEDVGGNKSRTVRLDIETGEVQVQSFGNFVVFE